MTGGKVIGFGQASDMTAFKPAPRVTSIVNNWGPYYFRRIAEMLNGKYKQADAWEGIGSGVVLIGQITEAVPPEVRAEAEALRDAIGAGTASPFTGPINRQDGTVWLAEGEVAPDADIMSMDFFVEGIEATLSQ